MLFLEPVGAAEVVGGCEPLVEDPPEVPSIATPAPVTDAATPAVPLVPPTPLAPLALVLSGTLPDLEARRLQVNEARQKKRMS